MKFEWDDEKAKSNQAKHKVSFEEAQTVFYDPFYLIFADPDRSKKEARFIALGASNRNRLLVVAYTERSDLTWLITARKATPTE
ncbi:MAG: BrnT family toxin [Pyrinomonadaceae bacterium]|nr:BrnT family toxin [Pyrinomonadaceae bacterium]